MHTQRTNVTSLTALTSMRTAASGRRRPVLFALSIAAAGAAAFLAAAPRGQNTSGEEMVVAAERLVAALAPSEQSKAVFSFDNPERLNWHFIPRPRQGLPVKEMNGAQRSLTHALLHAGVGRGGYLKATTIMSLESVLHDLEGPQARFRRDPDLYYLSIFGQPSQSGKWGWRIEGHHLSLNFVVDHSKIVSATPAFFGANPAEVKSPHARSGLRTLAAEEDLARQLLHALGADERRVAVIADKPSGDVRSANAAQPPTDGPVGLAASKMSEAQVDLLIALVENYARNLPPEVAEAWLKEVRDAGVGRIHFAWAGGANRGEPHSYRVQGPTFLMEYNNTQNGANHIHSFWRSLHGDFGIPL